MMSRAHTAAVGRAILLGLCACLVWGGCRFDVAPPPQSSPAPPAPELPHAGSGIVVHEEGLVLTHAAVVEGARTIVVELSQQDRRARAQAEIVARDDEAGLVLLRSGGRTRWVMRWRQAERPDQATACGWPLLGLVTHGRHEREMTSATGPVGDDHLGFPLAPGYEGGVIADENARGIGMIATTVASTPLSSSAAGDAGSSRKSALLERPSYVPAPIILRFLAEHGIAPPAERADFDRPWRVKLGWLQNYTVQIERDPPRRMHTGMPRLIRSHHVDADDISRLAFANAGNRLTAECWKAPDRSFRVIVEVPVSPAMARRGGASPLHRRDQSGGLFEMDAAGTVVRDLGMINGIRGFNARGPLYTSADGRMLLAGDALVWVPTGTVIWRLGVRADEALTLSPDGRILAHAPAQSPGTINLWSVPEITP